MANLGRFNRLTVLKRTEVGIFVDGGQFGEILLPRKYVETSMRIGDDIDLFLYNDSEDRIIATTQTPKVQVGECAYLKVVSSNKIGAFLDWGLPKDLLVPFSEQQKPMHQGYSYTAYAFVDESSQRIAASTRLEDHLSADTSGYRARQAVDLMIYGKSDLGFKAVINGTHLGQLYENETFRRLHYGEHVAGYIRHIRSDGRIDLMLQLPSHLERDSLSDAIVEHLQQNEASRR